MSKVVMISSDCHAGALPDGYKPYMPKEFHAAADTWWLQYAREMMKRMGTFFDQEAAEEFNSRSGNQGAGRMDPEAASTAARASDSEHRHRGPRPVYIPTVSLGPTAAALSQSVGARDASARQS